MSRAAGHKGASPWDEDSPQQHPREMTNGTVPAPPCAKSPGSVGNFAPSPAVGRKSWDGLAKLVVGVCRIWRESEEVAGWGACEGRRVAGGKAFFPCQCLG